MEIIIREMQKDEAALVQRIGRPSFGFMEGLFFDKPKNALVAVIDGEIVGATAYKIFSAKDHQKIGYISFAFVKRGYEGKGIGTELYRNITSFLKEKGCATITATVKDDNVASWKLFENNGYNITSFSQILDAFGIPGAILFWINSIFAISTGFHLWTTLPPKSTSAIGKMGLYLFLNTFIFLPILLFEPSPSDFLIRGAAFLTLLIASVLGGKLATLFSKNKWDFHVMRGGVLIAMIITTLGGAFPIVGRFLPRRYNRTPEFRRSMALEGLSEWFAVLVLVAVGVILKEQSLYWKQIVTFGVGLLLYHSLPFYPFECFGGKRIWDYSKLLSVFTMAISVTVIYVLW